MINDEVIVCQFVGGPMCGQVVCVYGYGEEPLLIAPGNYTEKTVLVDGPPQSCICAPRAIYQRQGNRLFFKGYE
jgi:hypothetical protein